ncbi:MAG: class I SAM-dependent methyltransferase [Clostridiales bacterium]|jgi:tRNA (adenine22-N1)-methyltransferase|nr:class I SAM-dependent methyltransferase [Clostridiales bacterium]
MERVKLSARLAAAAALVKGDTLCDIGCDHGYLPVFLCEAGRLHRAVAADKSPGSLDKARRLIEERKLDHIIETRLGDGLAPVAPGEASVCCIAGMGGMNIISILEARPETAAAFRQLILSPNRDHAALRMFLHRAGFRINNEQAVYERGVIYFIIDASPGAEPAYDDIGYMFGAVLLERGDPVLKQYIEAELERTQRLLASFNEGGVPERLAQYAAQCQKSLEIISTCKITDRN